MWCRGLELVSENRVAVVVFPSQELISNDIIEPPFKSSLQCQMQQVSIIQELAEVIITFLIILNSKMNTNQFNICKKSIVLTNQMISGEKCVIPLIVATSEELEVQTKTILHDESYFGLLEKQVYP